MIAASLNRGLAYLLFAVAAALAAVGVYLGAFAWANDGLIAGVRLFGTTAAFAAGAGLAGLAFRFAAQAHASRDRRRWWIQLLAFLVGYVAFGLAATASSFLDRM